jgi:hypothetical protein
MPALDSKLRSQLDNVCQAAREKAEEAANSALMKRAVDAAEPFAHFTLAEKALRNRLRARGRQAGDVRNADKTQSIDQLAQELAYEYWHRMLFARFLAENQLLMHPDGVAVSLEECQELAPSATPPAPNGFVLAARYASTMLPQIFRIDDVLLEVDFAPEQRLALEKLLSSLPRETFLADDSLGWVYQFWQTKKKKQVNKSGDKIDGRTLSAVTQLFTEHYMVQFLLHNTIGAWWCAHQGVQGQPGGDGVPSDQSPVEMECLRWRDDGTPAAGRFEGWPKTLAEFTLLDPCCGSGHFLVAAFNLLVPLRMQDEHLTAKQACEAVLRDNLFGLELDPRCTQIAAFALAVAAWTYPDKNGQPLGYRVLPPLNIACSGIAPEGTVEDWVKLADHAKTKFGKLGRDAIRNGLENLHKLFSQASTLGSLINPHELRGDVVSADFETLAPLFADALAAEADDDTHERAVAAAGMVKAAEFLAGEYNLVITNVPYLGRGKQDEVLCMHLEEHYPNSKADLATAFTERCLEFSSKDGTTALVTPQNWWFLTTYSDLRSTLLSGCCVRLCASLGEDAWRNFGSRGPQTLLMILLNHLPTSESRFWGIDASALCRVENKRDLLNSSHLISLNQARQFRNPDHRITLSEGKESELLSSIAHSFAGIQTGDYPRFVRSFWENAEIRSPWEKYQRAPLDTSTDFGMSEILLWDEGRTLSNEDGAVVRGQDAFGKKGILVGLLRSLKRAPYSGCLFDQSAAVLIPKRTEDSEILSRFVNSADYLDEIRRIDKKKNIAPATLKKAYFCRADWQLEGSNRTCVTELDNPSAVDPTQWLFTGNVINSIAQLQVAVIRLLGYHWPEQLTTADAIDALVDRDGIVCLTGVREEAAATDRLLEVLHVGFGSNWSDSDLHTVLTESGAKSGTTLDDWLRNQFFEQHCKLFHNRPFIWHIWDGRKDGFAVLVNCHKLDHKALENLTYAYLGDWITAQTAETRSGKTGADLRLAAAQELQAKLKLIFAGEPPYDIFVRWKPLHEQSIGWNPDLNDGVRMNIRPFMEAGILRKNPNIKWTKDRGKEPERPKADYPWFWNGSEFVGDRVNDVHLTNEQKQSAKSKIISGRNQR